MLIDKGVDFFWRGGASVGRESEMVSLFASILPFLTPKWGASPYDRSPKKNGNN